jgi:hypothetical protein
LRKNNPPDLKRSSALSRYFFDLAMRDIPMKGKVI